MNSTNFYCPECEARDDRQWLLYDGEKYRCPHCASAYREEELRTAYADDIDALESDAEWIRGIMAALPHAAAA